MPLFIITCYDRITWFKPIIEIVLYFTCFETNINRPRVENWNEIIDLSVQYWKSLQPSRYHGDKLIGGRTTYLEEYEQNFMRKLNNRKR
mgnify:CR=1 FL=1